MDLLKVNTFTITRKGAVTYTDGYPVQGTATSATAFGNIQPAPAEMLEILSEADRKRSPKKVWTKTELRINDVITASDGTQYEVKDVSDWQQQGLVASHYEALALRIEA